MLAKFFSSEQRTAQRYIEQLSQSDADQRLTLLAQMRQAQDSGALQPVPVPLQQFLNEQLATEDNTEVKLALVAWIDDLDAHWPRCYRTTLLNRQRQSALLS